MQLIFLCKQKKPTNCFQFFRYIKVLLPIGFQGTAPYRLPKYCSPQASQVVGCSIWRISYTNKWNLQHLIPHFLSYTKRHYPLPIISYPLVLTSWTQWGPPLLRLETTCHPSPPQQLVADPALHHVASVQYSTVIVQSSTVPTFTLPFFLLCRRCLVGHLGGVFGWSPPPMTGDSLASVCSWGGW